MRINKPCKLLLISVFILSAASVQANTWQSLDGVSYDEEKVFHQVLSEKSDEITIEFEVPGMQENEVLGGTEYYTKIVVPGASSLEKSGKPALPTITKIVEVPQGAEVSAEIWDSEFVSLTGYNIYPYQLTYDDEKEDDFQIDIETYKRNAFFPPKEVSVGEVMTMRGHSMVAVTVNPFQFNPVTGELLVRYYFKLSVTYSSDSVFASTPNRAAPFFEKLVGETVVNPKPANTTKNTMFSLDSDPGAEYLIIAHDDFYNPSSPQGSPVYELSEHKKQKGLTVKIVRVSEIGSSPSADDIRDYIRDAYENWTQAPVYIVLIGDSEQIPVPSPNGRPTDLYYGAVDSSSDFLPDILVGRLPSKTMAEAVISVDKIIDYENNNRRANWKRRILSAAYFQDDGNDGTGNKGYLETAEEANAYLTKRGYYTKSVYTTNSSNPTTYYNGNPIPETLEFTGRAQATRDIIDTLNLGVVIAAHRDHGRPLGWSHPILNTNHISELNNDEALPLIFAVNCLSGLYADGDGFGEQLLEYENGGAIGYIGASVTSPTHRNHVLYAGFFDSLFADYRPGYSNSNSPKKMAAIMLHGKMFLYSLSGNSALDVFEMYNLQGDPELDIKVNSPLDPLPGIYSLLLL